MVLRCVWRPGRDRFNDFDPIEDTERRMCWQAAVPLSSFNDFDPIEDTESFTCKLKLTHDRSFNDFDPIEDTERPGTGVAGDD